MPKKSKTNTIKINSNDLFNSFKDILHIDENIEIVNIINFIKDSGGVISGSFPLYLYHSNNIQNYLYSDIDVYIFKSMFDKIDWTSLQNGWEFISSFNFYQRLKSKNIAKYGYSSPYDQSSYEDLDIFDCVTLYKNIQNNDSRIQFIVLSDDKFNSIEEFISLNFDISICKNILDLNTLQLTILDDMYMFMNLQSYICKEQLDERLQGRIQKYKYRGVTFI